MAVSRPSMADVRAAQREIAAAVRRDSGAARRLYRRLKGKSPAEVLRILEGAAERYAESAASELRRGIVAADRAALRSASSRLVELSTRRLTDGGLRDAAARWIRDRVARSRSYRVSPLEGPRTSAVLPDGTVWLSKSLHRGNASRKGVIDGLRTALSDAVQSGETATSLAQRLRDEVGHRVAITDQGPPSYKVPPELRSAEKAARAAIRASGDPEAGAAFRSTQKAFSDYANKLRGGKLGTRSAARDAANKLLRAVERGNAEAVDRAVKWYTWNREQEHQRLIARTETARAYNTAYTAASEGMPWIIGWEWVTDSDPCPLCEALAGQIIERGGGPIPPLHPNCECTLLEVLDESQEMTDAEWQAVLERDGYA